MESSLGKNLDNYESIRNETYTYEQKPINVDDFNDVDDFKEKTWKTKTKTSRGGCKK